MTADMPLREMEFPRMHLRSVTARNKEEYLPMKSMICFITCSMLFTLTLPLPLMYPVRADPAAERGFGVRGGFGTGPDQGVAGAQALIGRPLGFLRFAPSFDVGFGDDMTTYALNGDVQASIPFPGSRSSFYGGVGPTLVFWDRDQGREDLEIGLSLLAGIRLPFGRSHLYNVEGRFGISDVPEFRLLVGTFFGSAPPLPSDTTR